MERAAAPLGTPPAPPSGAARHLPTDGELLADFRATRSERAFNLIVARHGAMVFRTCRRLVGTVQEAEDAAQAAFLVLAQRPQAVNSSLAGWLHWLARNTSYRVVRARVRRTRHEEQAGTMRANIQPTAVSPHDLREEIDAALGKLPAPLREAVLLRYLEGHSQEEAASLAGVPQGTMARRSMEGLNRLRAILQRRGITLTAAALLGFCAQEASAGLSVLTLLPMKLAAARLGAEGGTAALVAQQVLNALFWAKVRLIALTTATVLAVAVAVPVGVHLLRSGDAPRADLASPSVDKPVLLTTPFRVLVTPGKGEINYCPADAVVIAPDGRTVASGRCDNTVRLWDAVTSKPIATLTGHKHRVRAVAFSSTGKVLASASWDKTVRLWDVAGRKELHVLNGHTNFVWDVAFARDDRTLASVGWDGTARLWDVETGRLRHTLQGHRGGVHCTAFSPDGKTVATGGADGTVRLWDAATGKPLHVLDDKKGDVMSLAFAPRSNVLAAASMNGVVVYDLATHKPRHWLPRAGALGVAFSPDGASLAVTGMGTSVGVFRGNAGTVVLDAATCEERTAFTQPGCWGWSVAYTPDGQALAVGYSGTITLLNPEANGRSKPSRVADTAPRSP